jgi:hypothetical protein
LSILVVELGNVVFVESLLEGGVESKIWVDVKCEEHEEEIEEDNKKSGG